MRNNFLFLIFVLVITLGLLQGYNLFKNQYNGLKETQEEVVRLKKEVETQKFKKALLVDEFRNFQQQVARAFPDSSAVASSSDNEFVQKFKQTLRKPASETKFDFSGSLLDKAKDYFRDKNFAKTIEVINELLEKYPLSSEVSDALFLLSESYFLIEDYPGCLKVVDRMMRQFPEQESTGFIMLRMGQVFEIRHRKEDALEVYRLIKRSYANKDLINQTQMMLDRLEK
jgi:TolA-binding protein